jgi:predicted ATPase
MDWSYGLLSESERNLLNQLSVFAGDFSLEAVERICILSEGSRVGVIDLHTALVDNSLVNINDEC